MKKIEDIIFVFRLMTRATCEFFLDILRIMLSVFILIFALKGAGIEYSFTDFNELVKTFLVLYWTIKYLVMFIELAHIKVLRGGDTNEKI